MGPLEDCIDIVLEFLKKWNIRCELYEDLKTPTFLKCYVLNKDTNSCVSN